MPTTTRPLRHTKFTVEGYAVYLGDARKHDPIEHAEHEFHLAAAQLLCMGHSPEMIVHLLCHAVREYELAEKGREAESPTQRPQADPPFLTFSRNG